MLVFQLVGGQKLESQRREEKGLKKGWLRVLEVMINLEQNCALVAVCASVANWLAALWSVLETVLQINDLELSLGVG